MFLYVILFLNEVEEWPKYALLAINIIKYNKYSLKCGIFVKQCVSY
jgi:hypothetical protein